MTEELKDREEGKEPPESWKKFLDLAGKIVNVPKEDADRLEEERKQKKEDQDRTEEGPC